MHIKTLHMHFKTNAAALIFRTYIYRFYYFHLETYISPKTARYTPIPKKSQTLTYNLCITPYKQEMRQKWGHCHLR
jgi:hypothetical protein